MSRWFLFTRFLFWGELLYRVSKTHCQGHQDSSKRVPIFLGTHEANVKMVPIYTVPVSRLRTVCSYAVPTFRRASGYLASIIRRVSPRGMVSCRNTPHCDHSARFGAYTKGNSLEHVKITSPCPGRAMSWTAMSTYWSQLGKVVLKLTLMTRAMTAETAAATP